MNIKPQDIVVVLKLVALGQRPWTYQMLSSELCMSASEINSAVKRSVHAGLCRLPVGTESSPRPMPRAIDEFLKHGLKYVFPPETGGLIRGVPTGFAAPPLRHLIKHSGEPDPVWPWSEGTVRGLSIKPLYSSVPEAALLDESLYKLLALVDVIRGSSARGRDLASIELEAMVIRYDRS